MLFSQEQRVFILEHYFVSRSYVRIADEFAYTGDVEEILMF
jgi:hypothetical protein